MPWHAFTRKTQERQVFCESAYPLRSVTEQKAKYFAVFFRKKSTRVYDRAFLKTAQNFSAEQVDMQMMHRLTAVFALVDNDTVAVLQAKIVFNFCNRFKAVFERLRFFRVHFVE